MPLLSLRITDFRNLTAVDFAPVLSGLNIICGNNGCGKTSLLEAIYYLGLGRSFRSAAAGRLIRHHSEKFSVFSQLVSDSNRHIPVGVEREQSGSARWRMAEKNISSMTELAALLPIRLINSQSHNLFELGPVFRRKYLDWGLFYQNEGFLLCWRQFERVLKQRNAVLRDKKPKKELAGWTEELVKYGLELDTLRRDYLQSLTPLVVELTQELLVLPHLELHYQPGWNQEKDYSSVLSQSYPQELSCGHTLYGPHRADLDIRVDGIPVKHFLSRGQQKLLICAMILAQGMLLTKHANKGLIYLVDDLPAELDLQSKQKLISLLSRQPTQIFITAIESEAICGFINDKLEVPMKVFHVEHGSVEQRTE